MREMAKRPYESVPTASPAEPTKDEDGEVVQSDAEAQGACARTWSQGRRRMVLAGVVLALVGVLALAANALRPCPARVGSASLSDSIEAVSDDGVGQALQAQDVAEAALEQALDPKLAAEAEEAKRRMLKAAQFVGQAAAFGAVGKSANMIHEFVEKAHRTRGIAKAVCTFNTLQAAASLARAAVNIKEAVDECHGGRPPVHKRVCAVDIGIAIGAISRVASVLSSASSFCAETLNVDALCSASITGLIAILAEGAASAGMTLKTCSPDTPLPEGGNPGTIGEYWPAHPDHAFAASVNASLSVPARRLWLGGGEAAMTTECVIDANQASFVLAQAALFLTKATTECEKPSPLLPPDLQNIFKAKCAQDVSLVLSGFSQAVQFLSWTATHCTMAINNRGLCAASISALMAAMSGVAAAGASMDIACVKLQKPPLKGLSKLLPPIRRLEEGGATSGIPADIAEQIAKSNGDGDALWKSIGFDLSDPKWHEAPSEEEKLFELKPDDVKEHLMHLARPAEKTQEELAARHGSWWSHSALGAHCE